MQARIRFAVPIAAVVVLAAVTLPAREAHAAATTYKVNSTADPGTGGCNTTECTLREAITAANANAGTDTISFGIGLGVKTITPASALPTVTDPVVIDGTTQRLGFPRSTNCFASTGHPCIVLNGSSAGQSFGLYVTAGSSTVKGLVIQGFYRMGIRLESGGSNTITNDYIGTDATGTSAVPNGQGGIEVYSSSNIIGGPTASLRNVISGNGVGAGGRPGLYVPGSGNDIESNYIGTNAAGTAALGNTGAGIWLQAANTVGGASGGGNVISGNPDGILANLDADGSLIRSNRIGTDWSGTAPVANTQNGVQIDSNIAVTGNIIAFNGSRGVLASGTGNAIRNNSIHSNGGLGIDLMPSGVTPNDPGDADTGANNLQNYPEVRFAASTSGFGSMIAGTLDSTPNTAFTLDLYSNDGCDPSGYGEGASLISAPTVMTDGTGIAKFRITLGGLLDQGDAITATATDPSSNTSEFSACRTVSSLVTVEDYYFAPTPTTVPQGIAVGWDFRGLKTHNATDTSGMKLFGSGDRAFGASYTFTPPGAGTYPYFCTFHPAMKGVFRVPVVVTPSTGTTSTSFQVTWAPGPAPSGYVYDSQIKRPGSAKFVAFKVGKVIRGTKFTPGAGPGTYSFRARLRKLANGKASRYSPPASISVS